MLSTLLQWESILAPRSLVAVDLLHRCIRVFCGPSELTNFTNLTTDGAAPHIRA